MRLPALVATEELRIGSIMDATTGFSLIGSVAVDADGNGLPAADGRFHVAEADPRAFAAIRAELDFPPLQTPYLFLPYPWGAGDGSLWLRGEDLAATHRWYVIDMDGELAVTELPRWVTPVWSGGAILYAVEWDMVNVPWLVRYRLARHER